MCPHCSETQVGLCKGSADQRQITPVAITIATIWCRVRMSSSHSRPGRWMSHQVIQTLRHPAHRCGPGGRGSRQQGAQGRQQSHALLQAAGGSLLCVHQSGQFQQSHLLGSVLLGPRRRCLRILNAAFWDWWATKLLTREGQRVVQDPRSLWAMLAQRFCLLPTAIKSLVFVVYIGSGLLASHLYGLWVLPIAPHRRHQSMKNLERANL